MKNMIWSAAILVLGASLISCSTNQAITRHGVITNNKMIEAELKSESESNNILAADKAPSETANSQVGGEVEKTMDANDKSKMLHALDKSLGKPTHWENANTNISYTVVPVKKLEINGNHFCRQYTMTSMHNDVKNQMTGTACVSAVDSSWQVVN